MQYPIMYPRFGSTVDGDGAPERLANRRYCETHGVYADYDFVYDRHFCDECDADIIDDACAEFCTEVGCKPTHAHVTLHATTYSVEAVTSDCTVRLDVDPEHNGRVFTLKAGDYMGQGGSYRLARWHFEAERQRADEAAVERSRRAASARRHLFAVGG